MRLALVTHNVVAGDGQGRVNLELARRALAAGVEVTLVADCVDEELVRSGARWLPVKPRMRSPILLKIAGFAREADRLLRQRRGEFDLIHGNGYTLSVPHHVNSAHYVHAAALRRGEVTPGVRGVYHQLYARLNAAWERRAYSQAQVVTAVSGKVREELRGIGVPEGALRVIHNGVSLPQEPSARTRRELGLPEDVPLALFAGDLRTPRKNLDTVLRALALTPGLHLAVAGALDGSPYPALARELGLTERVAFLGYRSDLPALFPLADLFLCPSRYEPFSLVLLEALAAGVPVVTASTVGAAELVGPAGTVLPDPENVERMAEALQRLLAEPHTRQAMAREARPIAARHTWDGMADAYLKLYREVLS